MPQDLPSRPEVTFSPCLEPGFVQLQEKCPAYSALLKGDPGGFVLTPKYAENWQKIRNFQVRPDDTWVVTFPKCGTTWTQELVWLLKNNCDFEKAKKIQLDHRFPFLELPFLPPEKLMVYYRGRNGHQDAFVPFETTINYPSPRLIKTHVPFYLLPANLIDTAKVIYVARNPKDVIVSYYHHHKLFKIIRPGEIDIEQFARYFIGNEIMYCPFFPHILEAWNKRHHPNLLFIFFEDLKKDLAGQIRKVAAFFNEQVDEEMLQKLVEHLKFENLSKNKSVNNDRGKDMGFMDPQENFLRKGEIGDWQNYFSADLNEDIDRWIEDNLKNTDLFFTTK